MSHEPDNLLRTLCSVLGSLVLALASTSVHAQSETGERDLPDFSDVQQQAMELKKSVLTYGEGQRQALITETEAALANFDQRIERLEATLAEQESEMSSAAERYASNMLETLERQRAEFNEWLATLQADSRGTWDEVMHGFSNAYDEFYNSWENLESEFGSSSY